MKLIFLIFLIFIFTNCSKPKTVLICGDHVCINKTEAQQYFEENLTIEVKVINKKIENKVDIGPYARIRPGVTLKEGSRVGNFVEIKKSTIGKKSKVNHLSYIGDSNVGKSVNIGAGTITCNYDGVKKSKTKIKNNVFIGSNSSLVAPVMIEEDSVVGAGSIITKKVRKKSLALTRASQIEVKNYKKKKK